MNTPPRWGTLEVISSCQGPWYWNEECAFPPVCSLYHALYTYILSRLCDTCSIVVIVISLYTCISVE